jgi:prepilin-type N-terminal cleavage/methylation domain-containing protein/prepilin-type processing-associated H-X9-DG protein
MLERRGFTLIELLVVIAIIAILAAILFPVFARARESSIRVRCTAQLKQWHLAISAYAEDYDGVLPGQLYDDNRYYIDVWGNPQVCWAEKMKEYVRNHNGISICPSNPEVPYQVIPNEEWTSYLFPRFCNFLKMDAVQSPTSIVMLWERGGVSVHWGTYPNPTPIEKWNTPMPPKWDSAAPAASFPEGRKIHGDGSNFLFLDGHVKWMKNAPIEMFWEPWLKYTPRGQF